VDGAMTTMRVKLASGVLTEHPGSREAGKGQRLREYLS
jgi:hypothetical protein